MAASPPPETGFPCPECGATVGVSVEALVSRSDIVCPGCGVRFQMDAPQARDSMKTLGDVMQAMKDAQTLREGR